jgi:hypothetical protein
MYIYGIYAGTKIAKEIVRFYFISLIYTLLYMFFHYLGRKLEYFSCRRRKGTRPGFTGNNSRL